VRNPKEATAPKDVSYEQQLGMVPIPALRSNSKWAAAPGWTVTPGLKYVHFKR